MRHVRLIAALALGFAARAQALQASPAEAPLAPPWWVSGTIGEGQLKLSSDQLQGNRVPTFELGFAGGRRLGNRARAGLELSGLLLQAFDLNDPTVGESVSNVMGVVDVFPSRSRRLFARGGLGWASYTNNHPTGVNGNGFCWEAGGGYEIPIFGSLRLAPIVDYAGGNLGDDGNLPAPQTGRKYSVIEFKIAVVYRFGH